MKEARTYRYEGKSRTLDEIAVMNGLTPMALRLRLKRNDGNMELALENPLQKRSSKKT